MSLPKSCPETSGGAPASTPPKERTSPGRRERQHRTRMLRWSKIDKDYVFEAPRATSASSTCSKAVAAHSCALHVRPRLARRCPSCTAGADQICDDCWTTPHARHLVRRRRPGRSPRSRSTRRSAVGRSRGIVVRQRFNYDFHVTLDESGAPIE